MHISSQVNYDRAEVIRDFKTGDSLCYAFIGKWSVVLSLINIYPSLQSYLC